MGLCPIQARTESPQIALCLPGTGSCDCRGIAGRDILIYDVAAPLVGTEIAVTNLDAYVKEYSPLAQSGIKNAGGKILAVGQKVTTFEGTPPANRVAIQQWDSLEKAQAWRNSAEFKKAREVGDKYAKFRSFAIEGMPQ
jgi:uncharacterized protein (DUF1330 family)